MLGNDNRGKANLLSSSCHLTRPAHQLDNALLCRGSHDFSTLAYAQPRRAGVVHHIRVTAITFAAPVRARVRLDSAAGLFVTNVDF